MDIFKPAAMVSFLLSHLSEQFRHKDEKLLYKVLSCFFYIIRLCLKI